MKYLLALTLTLFATASTANDFVGKCFNAEQLKTIMTENDAFMSFLGHSNFGTLVQIWVDNEGSFILLEENAEGTTCVRAFGQSIMH